MKSRLLFLLVTIAMLFTAGAAPAAGAPAGAGGKPVAVANAPTDPRDETKVPHYFGPYPNWANSPQVLTDAIVKIGLGTPTPVVRGNQLMERAFATDFATPPGELGPVFVVLTGAQLPAGTLQNFQIWNQGSTGGSPTPSANNLFHAYVLRPTGVANTYSVVYDSGLLTVPVPSIATGEVATFGVTGGPAVNAGDVIGFYGEGIPLDTGVALNPDTLSTPATADPTLATNVAPALGSTITLGVDPGFPIYSQDRTYSFAATVAPTVTDPGTGAEATAVVDPKTGGISAVTVTNPGAGYVLRPTVSITAAGVTPTSPASATAVISQGVIQSIAVNETGFGFTAPAVTITGGNPTPGSEAVAFASGGVDNITLTDGGSGFTTQPLVQITLPNDPAGTQATAVATMDGNGVITAVDVVEPGSGYTSAPTVTIVDASQVVPTTPAVAVATIGISAITVTSGGAGYDSAPTVAINDTVGVPDKGASATATVAIKGSVTGITVTAPGAGYLTPGLKKFVDTLPGLGEGGANDLGQYIPVAVPDTTTYPGADYYEIGLVQYRMKFHRDLPATLLRGYVQLSTSVVPGKHIALTNASLDPNGAATPVLLPDGSRAYGVDNPHYLGPTIVATKDAPVRILFRNLLPTGADGNLFLPVDTSIMGAGAGPRMMTLDANGVPMDMAADEGLVTDGVRNPMCGETPKPATCYSEDRATLHLHGGVTPWISDGTPHQWTTPAGEITAYPQGVSVSNVPDMPDPGPGALTFFYTNQQSARLMFYHDHAWGITRLNVYAGEAAGYLVTDPMEQSLLADATATTPAGALAGLGLGSPLIVQDKTFVPSVATMAKVDPTWDSARWGGEGSLWAPHVYMPAQNPGDPSGMSAFGRWMYGPWFWPPAKDAKYPPIANPYFDATCDPDVQPFCEPALIPSTPNLSVGMEAFNDTPIVNGTAYPTTGVDPKAYRYRILNASNDRFWNLQWYVADPTTGTLSEVALKASEVAAAQTDPNIFPTPDTTRSPAGPSWIQIGTEGGFLPSPVIVPNQPITWITDPTRFDVGNVDQHALLLAPAERADVIVDFSQFRGKTLILYNDAPAAFPARVSSYDYYTGGPDLSPAGAPTTLPGYGPNTRTIMQVKVSTKAPEIAFDRPNTTADRMGALVAAFKHHLDANGNPAGVFEAGSDPIIVGQAAYNDAYGSSFVANGWCNSPTNPTAKCDGFARIQEQSFGTNPFKFKFNTLLDQGPNPTMAIPFQPKGLHDEMNSANFDEWGRMTANLGLEAPGATPLLQNIILYPYVNPATELLDSTGMPSSLDVTPISSAADGTQIWKITHNGVDTHPIHWHLYDVQVLNRVTWDNIIIPPEPTELGWKETVRISPLEDTIVALRPIVPTLPFAVPDSVRPLNPMMPEGAKGDPNSVNGTEAGFNNTDTNGSPIDPIVNTVENFGWEYVYHCHILSHEEMDMMRPVTVEVPRALPDAPVATAFTAVQAGAVVLSWTDGTPITYAPANFTNWGSSKAEIGYRIERSLAPGGVPAAGPWTVVGKALANQTTIADTTIDPFQAYAYRVVAYNAAGDSVSAETLAPPAQLPTTTALVSDVNPSVFGQVVTFTASVTPLNALLGTPTGTVDFTVDGSVVATAVPLDASGAATYSTSSLSVATHPVTAAYSGATDFVASTSPILTQVVGQAASTTVVTSDVNPSNFGQAVIFTATVGAVAPGAGTPTGDVQWSVDGVAYGTPVALVAGQASLPRSDLPVGTSSITAAYAGSIEFAPSTSAALPQIVNAIGTTTTVTSDTAPSVFGQSVTFTATVSAVAPGAGTPSGNVQWQVDGVNQVPTVALDANGTATFVTSSLPAGSHTITAIYLGTASLLTSTGLVAQTVDKSATTTAVTSGLNPSTYGQSVTFTATVGAVAPGAGTPAGSIQWQVDGANQGPAATLNGSGNATLTIATLPAGTRNVTAVYAPTANFLGSQGAVIQTVRQAATTTAVTSSANPSVFGQSVTFTATVSTVTPGAGTPTGTIQWRVDNVLQLPTVTLNAAGKATLAIPALTVGTHSIAAIYAGTPNLVASTSPNLAQTVNRAATTTVVTSSVNPSVFGQTVTFTATVRPVSPSTATPTGTIQWRIDGARTNATLVGGQATFTTPALTRGTHTVVVIYNATTSFTGSTSPTLTQTVNRIATRTVVTFTSPVAAGATKTYTATITAVAPGTGTPRGGTVQFRINGVATGGARTVTNGRATLTSNRPRTAGTYTITAVYSGGGNYLGSTSAGVTLRVN